MLTCVSFICSTYTYNLLYICIEHSCYTIVCLFIHTYIYIYIYIFSRNCFQGKSQKKRFTYYLLIPNNQNLFKPTVKASAKSFIFFFKCKKRVQTNYFCFSYNKTNSRELENWAYALNYVHAVIADRDFLLPENVYFSALLYYFLYFGCFWYSCAIFWSSLLKNYLNFHFQKKCTIPLQKEHFS